MRENRLGGLDMSDGDQVIASSLEEWQSGGKVMGRVDQRKLGKG